MEDAGYLPTPVVLRLTKLPASTLDYWVRIGLAQPSIRPSQGRRRTRRWSVQDVVSLRALKALHEAGCPHRLLVEAKQRLADAWEPQLRDRLLFWDGMDLLAVQPWGTIESIVRQPMQAQLHVLAIPLDVWTDEAQACIVTLKPSVDASDTASHQARDTGHEPRQRLEA
jgi:DNA-binding transcriptional MerR regulator